MFQDILEDHLRHAAFSSAQDVGPFQVFPGKVRHLLAGYKEIAGPLGELGEVDYVVSGAFIVGVDRGFRAHKPNVRAVGEDGGHCLVSAKSGHQFQVDAFFLEISFFDGHIHGRIEDGVSHLVEDHFRFFRKVFSRSVFFFGSAGAHSGAQHKSDK